jgi:hypothetical protein
VIHVISLRIIKAHRVLACFGNAKIMVFMVQRFVDSPITFCTSSKTGHVSMGELSTIWSAGTAETALAHQLNSIEAFNSVTKEPVKLLVKLRNRDIVVLECASTTWRALVFGFGDKSHFMELFQLTDRSSDTTCHDFQPMSKFLLVATSVSLIEGYDIRTGNIMFSVDIPVAPSYSFVLWFNPKEVFLLCHGVGIHIMEEVPSQASAELSTLQEACDGARLGHQPRTPIPPVLSIPLTALYDEISPHHPPRSLLQPAPTYHPTIPTSEVETISSSKGGCQASLMNHQRLRMKCAISNDVPPLDTSVVDYLQEALSQIKLTNRKDSHSYGDDGAEIVASDFVLSIRADRSASGYETFEVTCRYLYEFHPELLGLYVRIALDTEKTRFNTSSLHRRAFRCLPPSPLTSNHLVPYATVLCLCGENEASLALLAHSWTETLQLVDALDILCECGDIYERLLCFCALDASSDMEKLSTLLEHFPHRSFTRQRLVELIERLCTSGGGVASLRKEVLSCLSQQLNKAN